MKRLTRALGDGQKEFFEGIGLLFGVFGNCQGIVRVLAEILVIFSG